MIIDVVSDEGMLSSRVENCYWSMFFSRRVTFNICVLRFDWLTDAS